MRQGVLADEGVSVEPGQAGSIFPSKSILALLGRTTSGLQHASERGRIANLSPDRGKGIIGGKTLVGAVEDFPVSQLTSSTQAEASCSDTSEREGDHFQPGSPKHAWIRNAGGGSMRGVCRRRFDSGISLGRLRLRGGPGRDGGSGTNASRGKL